MIIEEVIKYIMKLYQESFYGELIIKFNAGNVVIIDKKESIKKLPK